jgi:regulator of RNase E activity RraA
MTNSPAPIDPQVLETLRRYDTPTVLNAIELFDVRPRHEGFADGRIRACFPEMGPVVGYATTATFTSARAAQAGDAYATIADQVAAFEREVSRPRVVVFQDIDPEPVGATFGEVMCTVYKAFGCVGLVTSGGARDLDQVRRLGFPCWSSSVIASHAWCRIVDVNVEVDVAGMTVRPGDIVHADCNGVALVPREIAEEVAIASGLLAEAEYVVLEYARRPGVEVEGLRSAYAQTKKRFAEIPSLVRARLKKR